MSESNERKKAKKDYITREELTSLKTNLDIRLGQLVSRQESMEKTFTQLNSNMDALHDDSTKIIKAIEEGLNPRIMKMEEKWAKLPDELVKSFTTQGEFMKDYIDKRLGGGVAQGQPPQNPNSITRDGGLLGFLDGILPKDANGRLDFSKLGGLLGSNQESSGVIMEIKDLEKLALERFRVEYRNSLRKSLNLPLEVPTTTTTMSEGGTPTLQHGV